MTDPLSLDDLFAEVKVAAKAARTAAFHAKGKQPLEQTPEEIQASMFANPDNWRDCGGVALIHRESKTLLGNFQVLRYRFDSSVRRLVRSETPIQVTGVEEVDFGYVPPEQPYTSPRVLTQVFHTADLELETPALSARHVLVSVHYYAGWTARVVLTEPTTFSSLAEILQLPAGVDILPVLSRESKKFLRFEQGTV